MLTKGDGQGDVKIPKLDSAALYDNAVEMVEEWNPLKDLRNEWEVDTRENMIYAKLTGSS